MVKFVLMNNVGKVHQNKGFTLIESIIALLIVSISLSLLIGSYEQNTRYLTYAKDKVLSQIVMNNLIVERRLDKTEHKIGINKKDRKLGKKTWYWYIVTNKFDVFGSYIEDVLRIQIEVFRSRADRSNEQPIQSKIIYVRK